MHHAPMNGSGCSAEGGGQRTLTQVETTAQKQPSPRAGTKHAMLIAMLQKPEGATIAEIAAATGWQAHTVRGAISGALKKKLGLSITSEKVDDRGRAYRIC